ncbi:MAG: sensor histidine kinase [Anaerolineae bacterium]|nr:sensor histidine kinase [Anaerolineae bacterium]
MNLVEAARKMTIGKTAVLRAVWLVVAVMTFGLLAMAVPLRYQMFLDDAYGYGAPLAEIGLSLRFFAIYFTFFELLLVGGSWAVGVVIAWRKSDDWFALLTAVTLLLFGFLPPLVDGLIQASPNWQMPLVLARWLCLTGLLTVFSLFPNGRFVPRWLRFVLIGWIGNAIIVNIFWPGILADTAVLPNTESREDALWVLFSVAWFVPIVAAQIYRYKRVSTAIERQQTKWVIFGFTMTVAFSLFSAILLTGFPGLRDDPAVNTLAALTLGVIYLLAALLLPITFAFAILRYRLWQIDIILNRTLVYGGLTAGVTAVYLLMVGGLGLLAAGQQWQLIGVVLATAVTAILLKPAQNQLQTYVNRLIPLPPVTPTAVTHPLPIDDQPLDLIPAQWQSAVRFFLLIFALGAMALLLGAIPARLLQLRTVCLEPVCPAIVLVPADFAILQEWGISASAYAIFHTAVELILIVPVIVLWVVIFRNCTHRWIGMLTCLGLVYLGVSLGNILWAWTQQSVWVAFLGDVVSEIGATALLLLLLLFPNGRFINRWTRYSAYLLLFVILPFGVINLILSPGLDGNLPDTINAMAFLLFMLLGAAAQIIRYRTYSNQAQKQQTKWVVIGVTSLMLGVLLWFLLMEFFPLSPGLPRLTWNLFGGTLMIFLAALFPVSLGLAILQYRLWDIDILINRTLVYGGLTLSIVVIYTLVVGGLSAILHARGNFGIALLATGFIAVLFQPLRERLQRGVNRFMFGERDDPYKVLSQLGRQLGETAVPGQTLPAITTTICQTLKLPYAAIQLTTPDGGRQTVAMSGQSATGSEEWPLLHQGELVGWLIVAPRSAQEQFTGRECQLLTDIAGQTGAAAYAVRLTTALQHSREKLVLAREEERRRIRRDLHDELGPTLASQTFAIDAILDLLESNPQEAARLLRGLKAQNQETVTEIRRLVYELRPPTLDELGLVGALQAHTTQINKPPHLHIQITATPEPLPLLSAAVEVAAYRIALEAMTNAARHAGAQTCTVHLQAEDTRLTLTVADDGRGLEANGRYGVGLHSMHERAEELGGRLTVESGNGAGVKVTAVVPISLSG